MKKSKLINFTYKVLETPSNVSAAHLCSIADAAATAAGTAMLASAWASRSAFYFMRRERREAAELEAMTLEDRNVGPDPAEVLAQVPDVDGLQGFLERQRDRLWHDLTAGLEALITNKIHTHKHN